ncbi:hypothetical protein COY23_00280 [bacterium (Candidatus Torokbacteria) CG_4_10_14_0_2_um_filter_35_8]|nr:MAG: hypothetical protein COY23_00280 [bacterium (Candidatus Torokbacteria) CG_4_10_14_0_2_um_filter_35_8]
MSRIRNFFYNVWRIFAFKNGKISKTAIILSITTFLILSLWVFQSLFAGVTFFGWWLIPKFNTMAASGIEAIVSSLYVLNHSNRIKKEVVSKEEENN